MPTLIWEIDLRVTTTAEAPLHQVAGRLFELARQMAAIPADLALAALPNAGLLGGETEGTTPSWRARWQVRDPLAPVPAIRESLPLSAGGPATPG